MDVARGMGRWVLWILASMLLTTIALFPIRAAVGDGNVADVLSILVFHGLLAVGGWREWHRNRARAAE